MTPIQREAAERLADELASVHPLHPYVRMCGSAAALLRELAAEPVQEPVAWIHHAQYLLAHAENSPPADKMLANGWTPLYTAPQQHKPLSDEQIRQIVVEASTGSAIKRDGSTSMRIARAIERAHGITGEQE